MVEPQSLLVRLLSTPDIEKVVPHLQPEVLHRVIQRCGLEDSAEIVALATPRQLERMLDVDVWRAPSPGVDEVFDADRFGVWLEVLMEAGAEVAAGKIVAIDARVVVAGLSHHVTVLDIAAAAPFTTLDGEQAGGRERRGGVVAEIGGYFVEAKRESAWDATVALLVCLDAEHPGHFHRLMRGCVRLSNGAREPDGFHDLFEDGAQDMFDLSIAREARREREGYVTPGQARAFLQSSRQLRLTLDRPPLDPVARAYFRAMAASEPESEVSGGAGDAFQDDGSRTASGADGHALAGAFDILRDAGVLSSPRALLPALEGNTMRLPYLREHVGLHDGSTEALAYLANMLVAGGSIQGREFTPQQASEAAASICNLGLENWPGHWPDRELIAAFQVGWAVLHRDVCLYSAKALIDILAHLGCRDRDIQLRLTQLRRELARHVRDQAPWRARNAMDAIVMLDAASWAGLLPLIDECPVLHAAAGASRRSLRTINPGDFVFISENSQIALVRDFMKSLPEALTR